LSSPSKNSLHAQSGRSVSAIDVSIQEELIAMLGHRGPSVFIAGILLAAVSAFGQTAATSTSTPSSAQFPPVGLAPTETAQVNVVNTLLPPANGGVEPFCSGTIAFYSGGPANTTVAAIAPFQVRPGEVFSAPLSYTATGSPGTRAVVRVAITLSPLLLPTDAGPAVTPCALAASLETFDTVTGVTHAIVSSVTTQDTMSVTQVKPSAARQAP
jgi:hypothetical protein